MTLIVEISLVLCTLKVLHFKFDPIYRNTVENTKTAVYILKLIYARMHIFSVFL